MTKIKIAIVDTGFKCTEAMARVWDGFTWESEDLVGLDYWKRHEHGTMVANFLMRPFDNDNDRGNVEFLHIAAGDEGGAFLYERMLTAYNLIEQYKPHVANFSLGGDDYDQPILDEQMAVWRQMADRLLELSQKTILCFAAGNGDKNDPDEDTAFPQRLLPCGGCTFLFGSIQKDGHPSIFSGDGSNVFSCFWGERVPVLNSAGKWTLVDGTSFASPKGAGVIAFWLGMGHQPELSGSFLRSLAIHKCGPTGEQDYVNPATGLSWHPKVGWGSNEEEYQTWTTDARSRPPATLPISRMRTSFYDFERLA